MRKQRYHSCRNKYYGRINFLIETVILLDRPILFFLLFYILFLPGFDRDNNRDGVLFSIFFFKPRRHIRHKVIHPNDSILCNVCPSHNMVGQAVINIRWVGENPQVHEVFVGLYVKRPSNRRRVYHDGNYRMYSSG